MKEKIPNYHHLIEIDEEGKRVIIYRIFPSDLNKKQLFTIMDLPTKSVEQDEQGFREFAKLLGENLLIDSPIARKLLGI